MDPEAELQGFIARFNDKVASDLRAARAKMRVLLPGAIELVYDNYNALAIGYGPDERQKHFICSIAGFPRWASLFLVGGPDLDDPKGLLRGKGGVVRHLVLDPVERLDDPDVLALLNQAVRRAPVPLDPAQPFRTVIRSVSANQRPRQP